MLPLARRLRPFRRSDWTKRYPPPVRQHAAVPSVYFLAARAVVNEVDPVGLIAMGSPDDEYDAEVEDLIKWREPVTPERVAEVFIRWFGRESGEMTPEDSARISRGINDARAMHLPQ